ncbi:MAG: ribonuclease III [Sulfuriflexus sp.]|nr:ribonuclease III [Sulfuriflexus sp.]
MTSDLSILMKQIEYNFNDEALLLNALTHRSVGQQNNERLEFLGDAILGMVVAEELFQRFPKCSEGEMSRLRASLVKGETLSELARYLSLGDYLKLGPGELKSGGFRRDSILADAFEAVLAAVYLDSDIETCRRLILSQLASRLDKASPETIGKDPKTQLQEYMQARHLPLPSYDVTDVTGKAHAQTFTVECKIEDGDIVTAVGSSRRKAEQAAASQLLERLNGVAK